MSKKHVLQALYQTLQITQMNFEKLLAGCKESHFHSFPFGQAEANIYQPKHHFN